MRITQIRQRLHDYIDNEEGKKLKAFYTLLEADITDYLEFTNAQLRELDKQYDDYVNVSSETNTWEQTIDGINLTKEQILMLQLSDNDIKAGRLISQEELDKNDLLWLKEL